MTEDADHYRPKLLTPALAGLMWVGLSGFAAFFAQYATLVTIGQKLGLTLSTAGTMLTVMMIAVVLVQPFVPGMIARWGHRKTIFIGVSLQIVSNLVGLMPLEPLLSLATSAVIGGLGFGLIVVAATATVPQTSHPWHFAKALSLFGSMTTSATVLGTPVGLWAAEALSMVSFRLLFIGLLLTTLIGLYFLPSHSQATKSTVPQLPRKRFTLRLVAELVPVLWPFTMAMSLFGLIVAFGPASSVAEPIILVVSMQVAMIIGRLFSGNLIDKTGPVRVNISAVVLVLLGISGATYGQNLWVVVPSMVLLGVGVGAVQSATLVMSFQQAGDSSLGSVGWNMTFDIGLSIAGLAGGYGITLLGVPTTFMVLAATVLLGAIVQLIFARASEKL